MQALPNHLKRYIVSQDYNRYTPIDHSVWRYILRQLRSFLSKHAHESYLDGLVKTGITVDRIPSIAEISQKLEAFGWRALPVSGFIPPAAFMEMQSLGILPIASDMRSIDHLLYTPAPDIVHEAAGHAPMLANPEFAEYLRQYAQVAKKAIISKEDMDVYEAIRQLSDIKENPASTSEQIAKAEINLNEVSKRVSHISEASILSRMNWWTAEYGLIGDLENPKIYGAGLLSSVGESRDCLKTKVKKIPMSVNCIDVSYDITEPQPQLFVTPNFSHLTKVLQEMANTMAFKLGGKPALNKAIQAQTVNTVELNSGIQASGTLTEVIYDSSEKPAYLKFSGPTQLSYKDKVLTGQEKSYHAQGFGTAIGLLVNTSKCLSEMASSELEQLEIKLNQKVSLSFKSGVQVSGQLTQIIRQDNKNLVFTFNDAKVTYQNQVLFEPAWGTYDMMVGSEVPTVFGGPADRVAFGETDDFIAARVPQPQYSQKQKELFALYQTIRDLRDNKIKPPELERGILEVQVELETQYPQEWLLRLEMLELLNVYSPKNEMRTIITRQLLAIAQQEPSKKALIEDGLALSNQI